MPIKKRKFGMEKYWQNKRIFYIVKIGFIKYGKAKTTFKKLKDDL